MQQPIDDETLVAYLDGELSREQHATIDLDLQVDASLRQRVNELRASWEMLAELPTLVPRQDLAQSTIEIVTLDMERESRSYRAWLLANRWPMLFLAILLMLLAGASAARGLTSYWTRQILANLPAIVDYPSLQTIDSVEFLDALVRLPNLPAAAGVGAERTLIGDGIVPSSISDRKKWVESLPEDSRGRLENHLLEYRQQSDQRKELLRTLTAKIYGDPSTTAQTLATIRAYRAILERWGSQPNAKLQEMSVTERIRAVKARVSVLMALSYVPSQYDREAFQSWLDSIVKKAENSEQYYIFSDAQIISELYSGDPQHSVVTQEDMQELMDHLLSPKAGELLRGILDETDRRSHLALWISSSMQPPTQAERTAPAAQDLLKTFSGLPENRQNALEFLPEEEVRKRLRQTPASAPLPLPQ